jgi:hypothetical protein
VFTFHKGFEPKIPDAFKVPHEAGIVFCPVPLIQLKHALAGIFCTFIAEFGFCFCQVAAVENDAIYTAG